MKTQKILIRPIKTELVKNYHKLIIGGPIKIADIKMLRIFMSWPKNRHKCCTVVIYTDKNLVT